MFRTHRHAEIPINTLYGDGIQLWSVVEHSLHAPWLYVTVVEQQHGQTFRNMLLVQEMTVFEALLCAQNEEMQVEDVQLVSPAHMNDSTGWRMEPLSELAQLNHAGMAYFIYQVVGGKRYLDRLDASIPEEKLGQRRVIFQRNETGQSGCQG